MDYTDICTGWIYVIENKINDKLYVGQTIDYNRRKKQHFCEEEKCPLLRKAFAKYGRDNFCMKPILQLQFINKEVRRVVLNELEQHFINKFNTYNQGYNITKGGMGHQGYAPSNEVKQKIKNANAEWWSNEDNKEKHRLSLPTKPILQYDREGKFINEYSSLTEASLQFDNQWTALQTISQAAREKKGLIYEYQWRYKEFDSYPLTIKKYLHKSSKPVYHYTKDGVLIKEYPDAGYAARELGVDRKYIISAVSWNSRHPESKKMKDYWSREAPVA